MAFIHSQHHALQESANSDVAACRRTPYRRGAAPPREVSRTRDFTRSHGLQTSILFLIPFIQFTCLPDCPLLTLGKDRNRRLLSQPRERLSSLKDSTNAVFFLHRHIQWAVSMATNIPPHSWISPISFYFFLSPSKRLSALFYYEELTVVNVLSWAFGLVLRTKLRCPSLFGKYRFAILKEILAEPPQFFWQKIGFPLKFLPKLLAKQLWTRFF